MVSKKILIIVALIIVASIGGLLSFVIPSEDFIVDEDFSIPSPALLQQEGYCTYDYSGFTDGYSATCEDPNWKIYYQSWKSTHDAYASSVSISNNNLLLETRNPAQVHAMFKKDLKYRDITMKMKFGGGGSYSSNPATLNVKFNDKSAYSLTIAPTTSVSKDIFFQAIIDDENKDLYHIIINGEETNTVLVTDPELNIKFQISADYQTVSTSLRVNYIKSKPYYSCTISDDEILFTDKFYSGSKFTLDSKKISGDIVGLTYKPLKFCRTGTPVLRRSLEEGGMRPEYFGTTFEKLVKGEIITVPADEVMEVNYVVDYVEGMGDSNCGADSYSLNGVCKKVVWEKEDIIEIINIHEFIVVGKNNLLFENSVKIADKYFSSIKPEYSCELQDNKASAPFPEETCWKTEVTYGTDKIFFTANEEKSINPYMKIKYIPEARFEIDEVQEGYVNHFLLTITNDNILEIKPVGENNLEDFYVIFGEEKNIEFEVTNNLGKFDSSGIVVKKTRGLLTSQESEIINLPFNKGTETYSIPVDSNYFGSVTYEILFWYKIGDQTYFDNEEILRNFEIVDVSPLEELEDKIQEINELEGTIAQKAQLIKELTAKRNEQSALIKEIELTIEEQAKLLLELEFSVSEQAQFINSLEINLAKKAELVGKLTVENEQQAKLIKLMELSFTEQGEIISELNELISDDAILITKITSENDEQVQIVAGLKRTIEEKELIIQQLSTSLEEEQELLNKLAQLEDEKASLLNTIKQHKYAFIIIFVIIKIGLVVYFVKKWRKRK